MKGHEHPQSWCAVGVSAGSRNVMIGLCHFLEYWSQDPCCMFTWTCRFCPQRQLVFDDSPSLLCCFSRHLVSFLLTATSWMFLGTQTSDTCCPREKISSHQYGGDPICVAHGCCYTHKDTRSSCSIIWHSHKEPLPWLQLITVLQSS